MEINNVSQLSSSEIYIPIVIMIAIALSFGLLMLAASAFLGPKYPSEIKDIPFECGWLFKSEDSRKKHSIKFYLIAIVFLIFDLEIIFIYPWATIFRKLGLFGLIEMFIFLGILLVGYLYIWKKGVLKWE